MNEAQQAALTEIMARLAKMQFGCPSSIPNDWATEQRERGEPIPSAHVCLGWVEDEIKLLLTALADAHLELQEAKDSRDGFACDLDAAQAEVARLRPLAIGQMFPCSRCGQEWLWPGVLSAGMATCPPCLRASNRAAWARVGRFSVEALENEVTRLTEERDQVVERAVLWLQNERLSWARILLPIIGERDQQREDIRRLGEFLRQPHPHKHRRPCANCALLAELKEKYGDA